MSINYFRMKNWLIIGSRNWFMKIYKFSEYRGNYGYGVSMKKIPSYQPVLEKLCCVDALHERLLKIFDVRFKKDQNSAKYRRHFGINTLKVLENTNLLIIGCKNPFSIMILNVHDVDECLSDAKLLFYS